MIRVLKVWSTLHGRKVCLVIVNDAYIICMIHAGWFQDEGGLCGGVESLGACPETAVPIGRLVVWWMVGQAVTD